MKPQRDIPGAWADRMVKLGFEYHGRPSARALADHAGVTVNAALRVIFRENFGEATALALGASMQDQQFVADWVAIPLGAEYQPPTASRMLTPRQRLLVDELINALAERSTSWPGIASPEDRQLPDDPWALASYDREP